MAPPRCVLDVTLFNYEILIETIRFPELFTWKPKFYKESENEREIEWLKYRAIISKKQSLSSNNQ